MTALSQNASNCAFCRLLYRTCSRLSTTERVILHRKDSTLKMQGINFPILSICRGLAIARRLEDIQIGFPSLPSRKSKPRIEIMGQWLKNCNENHKCYLGQSDRLPKRVLDLRHATRIRLLDADGLSGKYIALSHRWGDQDKNRAFSTTRSNIEQRMKEMKMSNLPKTFRDAVETTRQLGIQYLWIDSLCIIQDSDRDWDEQAKCMEDVFSSAYCVIAATRASGTSDGFLKPRPDRHFVTFPDGLQDCFYICEAIDDFDRHVTDAELNKRGWVFQERALARRTIHFSQDQTYWECGHGIRCETLTKMTKYALQHLYCT